MEETISLRELYETLKKRIVMIVLIATAAVLASGIYTYFFITPKYQASTQILISQQATGASLLASQFGDDSKYIETYNVILKSPYILDQVREELGITRSLSSQLSVSQEGRSQVVRITVQDNNPAMAVEIANVTAAIFQEEVYNLMRVDNVHVLSPAVLGENPTPISPNPQLNMAIAFVVGLMAAVGLAFLLEYIDNTIRTEQDIERLLELPVLGTIPVMEESEEKKKKKKKQKKDLLAIGSEKVGS